MRGFLEFGDLPPYEAMPKAKAAALESLRLDPRLPEGHTWLGVIHFLFDWDWAAAERELRRALQLQAEYAYAETWYATFLSAVERHDEALERIRARARWSRSPSRFTSVSAAAFSLAGGTGGARVHRGNPSGRTRPRAHHCCGPPAHCVHWSASRRLWR